MKIRINSELFHPIKNIKSYDVYFNGVVQDFFRVQFTSRERDDTGMRSVLQISYPRACRTSIQRTSIICPQTQALERQRACVT